MKKTVAMLFVAVLCITALACGCSPGYDKSPAEYKNIRWISYDYSFCIKPDDDCKGFYTFNDKKYNIKVTFDGSTLTATDTDKNKELFNADWMYEKGANDKETLYIHNIAFNKSDYKEMENNLAEYVTLKQDKV